MQGENWGKGDVSSLWDNDHKFTAGCPLHPIWRKYSSKHVGQSSHLEEQNAYIDEVDTYAASMSNVTKAAACIMTTLQKGTQKQSNVQHVVTASTEFHKCLVQILSYTTVHRLLQVNHNFTRYIHCADVKGAQSLIKSYLLTNLIKVLDTGIVQTPTKIFNIIVSNWFQMN